MPRFSILGVLLVLGLCGCSSIDFAIGPDLSPGRSRKRAKKQEGEKKDWDFEMTASELWREWEANPVACAEKYVGRRLRITGIVHTFGEQPLGREQYLSMVCAGFKVPSRTNQTLHFDLPPDIDLAQVRPNSRATILATFMCRLVHYDREMDFSSCILLDGHRSTPTPRPSP